MPSTINGQPIQRQWLQNVATAATGYWLGRGVRGAGTAKVHGKFRQAVECKPVFATGTADAALGIQAAFLDPVSNLAFRLGAVHLTIATYDMVFH